MGSKEDSVVAGAPFDAQRWMTDEKLGGHTLKLETIKAVSDFTLMWGLFEGVVCENRANINLFQRFSTRIEFEKAPQEHFNEINECFNFWHLRYRKTNKSEIQFKNLRLRSNDKPELVASVLDGNEHKPADKLLALLIIVYRLRNNLFHGIKSLEKLDDQVLNLTTASFYLKIMLNLAQYQKAS